MGELPFRQIHMDFHTSPHIDGVGSKFDAQEFASTLKKAGVNSINLFSKCHHGMYYYPTKIGTMHPSLEFDLLGAQMKACREEGIRTCIYTCVAWNEDWADRHPEWLQVNMQGVLGNKNPFDTTYYGWRDLCLNNIEHKEYLKAELKETYELYKPAGYWIDIILQRECICGSCMKEIKAMGLDPQNAHHVRRHDRLVEIRFMKEFYEYLKAMDEDLTVYFNGYPCDSDLMDDVEYSTAQKRRYNSFLDIESLPSDAWGYTHFPIAANYLNRYDQEIAMMNGKFHKAWGDFGTLRNLEALEYECFRAVANGAKCCVGDQLHPNGLIDKSVYQRIGEVFNDIKVKEKWLHNTKKVSQIGVFVNNRVLQNPDSSIEGAYRMLTEMHYLFDFIDFCTDLSGYDLLILPDSVLLTDLAAEKIKDYIHNGGKVILTGKSGLSVGKPQFALEEFGVEYISEAEFSPRYININTQSFPEILPMDYTVYESGYKVRALPGTKVAAYVANPYFNRTYDRFCSHRHTPPAGVSDEPAVTVNGGVVYISNPLFIDYARNGNKVYKDIVKHFIKELLNRPVIICDLPVTAEVTLRKQENRLIMHALNYIIQRKCKELDIIEEKLPLYNTVFRIKTEGEAASVYTVPQMESIDFLCADGYVEFVLPKIHGHQMVVIENVK